MKRTATIRRRRSWPALALGAALAVGGGFAAGATGASAATVNTQQQASAQQQVSQNWAGYVAQSNTGQNFTNVSGSWTEPTVSSSAGDGYSAFWVGIGGASQGSQALEQVGTSSDVVNGQTQYYAWYELVPAPETKLDLAVHPGDHMTGRVTVNGSAVTLYLLDQTTGQSANKTLQMSNPDTSSAEWIAEAPSEASQSGAYQVLPLANFGSVTFNNASTTAGGHTGTISDPNWNVEQVQLSSTDSLGFAGGGAEFSGAGLGAGQPSTGGATPSNVSSDGSSFSVSYSASGGAMPTSTSTSSGGDPGAGYGSGGGGYPGGGYGFGDGSGYGDGGGYGYAGGAPWIVVY